MSEIRMLSLYAEAIAWAAIWRMGSMTMRRGTPLLLGHDGRSHRGTREV
jgi:hypothetical protein